MVKKRTVKTTGKSRTAKAKKAEVEKVTSTEPRGKDQFGFFEGTDISITAHVLLEGGTSRPALYAKVQERIIEEAGGAEDALITRNGTQKNIPNLVATVVSTLKERGYVVESSWKMVKDPNFVEPANDEPVEEEPATEKVKSTKTKPRRRKATA